MTNSQVFKFKKFEVNQLHIAHKVGTDAVLLGSLANGVCVQRILDVGTGSGVIALMLAQRFVEARVDALEIEPLAVSQAKENFQNSVFTSRLRVFDIDFFDFEVSQKYDLIVSNPPFFIQSLPNIDDAKTLARHTNKEFFFRFFEQSKQLLELEGCVSLIVPFEHKAWLLEVSQGYGFALQEEWQIQHHCQKKPKRVVLTFGLSGKETGEKALIIKELDNSYTEAYRNLLQDFLTIF